MRIGLLFLGIVCFLVGCTPPQRYSKEKALRISEGLLKDFCAENKVNCSKYKLRSFYLKADDGQNNKQAWAVEYRYQQNAKLSYDVLVWVDSTGKKITRKVAKQRAWSILQAQCNKLLLPCKPYRFIEANYYDSWLEGARGSFNRIRKFWIITILPVNKKYESRNEKSVSIDFTGIDKLDYKAADQEALKEATFFCKAYHINCQKYKVIRRELYYVLYEKVYNLKQAPEDSCWIVRYKAEGGVPKIFQEITILLCFDGYTSFDFF